MRLACGPGHLVLPDSNHAMRVILYGQAQAEGQGSAGKQQDTRFFADTSSVRQGHGICCQSR